jgi:hypothetical protein
MILTDYYLFKKTATKSKTRLDCIASTHSYPEFEDRAAKVDQRETDKRDATKKGDILIYYGDVPKNFKGDVHRKAGKSISIKSKNLSSVYVPDVNKAFAYGDFRGTTDALLIMFHDFTVVNGVIQQGATLEIFVARGKSKDRVPLFELFADGGLDDEVEYLRSHATKMDDGNNEPKNPIGD